MSIVTTYTCDRCGQSQDNDTDMYELGVIVNEYMYRHHQTEPLARKLWCKTCLNHRGLDPAHKATAPSPPPDLEDLVREIVQDEIERNQ